MELVLKLYTVLFFSATGTFGQCDQPGLMECILQFSSFFEGSASSIDPTDEDGMTKLFCSEEGQGAFGCVIDYLSHCPTVIENATGSNPLESLQTMTGIDMQVFFAEGGMEGFCALVTGPCSEVKQCYQIPESGGIMKRGVPADSHNNYIMFVLQAAQLCGSMKGQVECLLEKLEYCPKSIVSKVESEFEKAIEMTMPSATGIVTFQATKNFMMSECDYLAKTSTPDHEMCVKGVFTSKNFTDCAKNVSSAYRNEKNCLVYDRSEVCIMEHVTKECGEEAASFFIRNANFIWPGIPSDCPSYRDTSSGFAVKMSIGIILISTIMSLMKGL